MIKKSKTVGRPRRYAEYDRLLNSIEPKSMTKRPQYHNGIGVFRGKRGDTVWIKFTIPYGGYVIGLAYFKIGNAILGHSTDNPFETDPCCHI